MEYFMRNIFGLKYFFGISLCFRVNAKNLILGTFVSPAVNAHHLGGRFLLTHS